MDLSYIDPQARVLNYCFTDVVSHNKSKINQTQNTNSPTKIQEAISTNKSKDTPSFVNAEFEILHRQETETGLLGIHDFFPGKPTDQMTKA